ncbi:hypothetical protein [Streptomyces sp. NPDC048521]|uniref:hypothetical protein n=1 Tax=Streptomyces sp. NPDC048521 TaxID=3365566 RepID=UPI0037100080
MSEGVLPVIPADPHGQRAADADADADADDRAAALVLEPVSDLPTLDISTPCCSTDTSLDRLDHDWPCGFGRFEIVASTPAVHAKSRNPENQPGED